MKHTGKSIYGKRHIPEKLPNYIDLKFGSVIGEGHFSHVYKGLYKNKYNVAIKVIERGDFDLISNEIDLLTELKGCPHIIQLYQVIRDKHTILVFERIRCDDIDIVLEKITIEQLRFLIQSVLIALMSAHSKGIVHRDVKIGNILIETGFTDVKLIDWGCGAKITNSMFTKAGSRTCRPPEMLLGDDNYGFGCDIWAVGVLILYILCGKVPWKSKTGFMTIIEMSKFFGSKEFDLIQDKIEEDVPEEVEHEMFENPIYNLSSLFLPEKEHLLDPNLIDLMNKLLSILPENRPTAENALLHPFFQK